MQEQYPALSSIILQPKIFNMVVWCLCSLISKWSFALSQCFNSFIRNKSSNDLWLLYLFVVIITSWHSLIAFSTSSRGCQQVCGLQLASLFSNSIFCSLSLLYLENISFSVYTLLLHFDFLDDDNSCFTIKTFSISTICKCCFSYPAVIHENNFITLNVSIGYSRVPINYW